MPRVVLTDATFPDVERERMAAIRYGASLEEARCKNADDVVVAATNTDVLLVQFANVTRLALSKLAPGAIVIRYGIGLDNIDLVAAREFGVKVAYIPDYATGEVADHTVSLALSALRKIIPLDRSVRQGQWDAAGVAAPIKSFAESTVGFVGFGRIGREVHARFKAFGFSSVVADPNVDAGTLESLKARCVDLDTLFATADVVTLHTPLTPTSHHVVNSKRLKQMKPTAIVVNTARGALIDPDALVEALRAGQIAGAALDVFEQEPLPANSALRSLSNVILTPHAAWYSAQAVDRLQSLAADEIERHLSGQPPRCPAPMPS